MAGTATLPTQASSAVATPVSGKVVVFADTDADALGVLAVKRSDGSVASVVESVGVTAPITSTGGATPTIGISAATDSLPGSMSAADKTKLDSVTAGAAVASVSVTAPVTNSGTSTAPNINVTTSPGSASAVVGTGRNVNTTAPLTGGGTLASDLTLAISAATDSNAGSMSAADKTKLDGITSGAAVASVGATLPITSTGGTTPTIAINAATDTTAGSMSASDKTKLDGMTAGAAVASVTGTAPIVSSGGTTPAISITAATTTAVGSMSSTDKQKMRLFIDPIADYGCKFDHRVVFDGATAGGTAVVTSATANFTSADVGKRVVLTGAGASGAQYVGTVSSINSTTSINVSPNTTTAVSAKGLQIHTDDLTAWTNLITDVNAATYAGAVIAIETPNGATPFGASGFTGRSGISSFLPTISKQVRISGFGGTFNSNIGDYTKGGGCCIAYAGTSNAPTAYGAVMTFAPVAGANNQSLKNIVLEHFWIDCRNGDQNEALKGISMQSCFAWQMNDIFVMDPLAVGIEFLVIQPGTAGALGEAKDCSRGSAKQVAVRIIEGVSSPGALSTTPTTTTSVITLSTTGQSLTLAAAITNQTTSGYVWVQTNLGYPVLVNFTGGGGTTTLTGCTVSLQDTINAPSTVSGSNVVACQPTNGCGFLLDGDLTANANLNHFDTCQVVGPVTGTWGPASIEFRNSDSNEFSNVVVSGGNATALAQPNRITKPGVRFMGSNSNASMAARNNVFKSGSAGVGGVSNMGILNTNAILLGQAGPNTWTDYQLGNGEAIPVVEGNSYFSWNPNGGVGLDVCPAPVAVTPQTLVAATQTLIAGSLLAIPPQGWQVGMTLRWTLRMTKTAAGAAIPGTFLILVNTTGTSAGGGTVATMALTSVGTAAADTGSVTIDFCVHSIGATAAGVAHLVMTHGLQTTGWMAVQMQEIDATMATWNSTTAQEFVMLCMTSGAAVVPTITQCYLEVLKPANP